MLACCEYVSSMHVVPLEPWIHFKSIKFSQSRLILDAYVFTANIQETFPFICLNSVQQLRWTQPWVLGDFQSLLELLYTGDRAICRQEYSYFFSFDL